MTSAANDNRRSAANDNNPFRFYVYRYVYPEGHERAGVTWYVGKGGGNPKRDADMHGRNAHFKHVVAKMRREGFEPVVERLHDGLLDEDAKRLEVAYIALYGRKDLGNGTLVNMTDGGEGASGAARSHETREKISKAHKGRKRSSEHRLKLSAWERTPEMRAKMSVAHSNPSPETRARMSAAKKGRKLTDEHRAKIGAATRERSRETQAKIVDALHKRGPQSAEFKGVYSHGKRWRAVINVHGTERKLGSFPTPEEAARAWDAVALKTRPFGTYLNFPEDRGLPPNDPESGRQAA